MEMILSLGYGLLILLMVPLLCSIYAGLVVARYVDFAQIRTQAQEQVWARIQDIARLQVSGRIETDALLFGSKGRVGKYADHLRRRGHTQASQVLLQVENEAFALVGKMNAGILTDHELQTVSETIQRWEGDSLAMTPNIAALITPFRWNL